MQTGRAAPQLNVVHADVKGQSPDFAPGTLILRGCILSSFWCRTQVLLREGVAVCTE